MDHLGRPEDPEQLARRQELAVIMNRAFDLFGTGNIRGAWAIVMGVYTHNRGRGEQVYFFEHVLVAAVLFLVGLFLLAVIVIQHMCSADGIFREVFALPSFLKFLFLSIFRFIR